MLFGSPDQPSGQRRAQEQSCGLSAIDDHPSFAERCMVLGLLGELHFGHLAWCRSSLRQGHVCRQLSASQGGSDESTDMEALRTVMLPKVIKGPWPEILSYLTLQILALAPSYIQTNSMARPNLLELQGPSLRRKTHRCLMHHHRA